MSWMDGSSLFGTFLGAKGCNEDLPWEAMQHLRQQAFSVAFASTAWPLFRLSLRLCNQLYRLCREKGFFLGKPGIATTDFLWQESVLLTVMRSPERKAM